jgi:hypothetical protein
MKVLFNCVSGYNGSCLKRCRAPFGLASPWKYPPDVAVYPKGQAQVDIIGGHRILSTQNEGGPAHLPVRHPLGALGDMTILKKALFCRGFITPCGHLFH